MVDSQLRRRDVRDERVLAAMERVPRHAFVPAHWQDRAYDDTPLSIGEGQTISQPYIVGYMTQLLELEGSEKVLEIGTGSGYQTAILAELADMVCTVERLPSLAAAARSLLTALGYTNIRFHVGDGTLGWPEEAPFEAILVTAGAPDVPTALQSQLADGGRLVLPVGHRHYQELVRVTRKGNRFHRHRFGGCTFVPLVGEQGWRNGGTGSSDSWW